MRKIKNSKRFIYFAILILNFAFVAIVFAAKEAEHVFTWKEWFWPVINFIILFVALILVGRKKIKEYFKRRTEMVEKSLKDAEEAKEFAKKTLDEVKERLKNTDQEANKILDAAKRAGEKEKEALIAEGERLKNKILEQAKTSIEFELQKAKEAIKSEAAIMALELAEEQIKTQLGKKEHEVLIDEYIKKLEVKN